jgi:hypothetical protein
MVCEITSVTNDRTPGSDGGACAMQGLSVKSNTQHGLSCLVRTVYSFCWTMLPQTFGPSQALCALDRRVQLQIRPSMHQSLKVQCRSAAHAHTDTGLQLWPYIQMPHAHAGGHQPTMLAEWCDGSSKHNKACNAHEPSLWCRSTMNAEPPSQTREAGDQ